MPIHCIVCGKVTVETAGSQIQNIYCMSLYGKSLPVPALDNSWINLLWVAALESYCHRELCGLFQHCIVIHLLSYIQFLYAHNFFSCFELFLPLTIYPSSKVKARDSYFVLFFHDHVSSVAKHVSGFQSKYTHNCLFLFLSTWLILFTYCLFQFLETGSWQIAQTVFDLAVSLSLSEVLRSQVCTTIPCCNTVYITLISCFLFFFSIIIEFSSHSCFFSTHWIQNNLLKMHSKSGHSLHKVCQLPQYPWAKLRILNIHIYGAKSGQENRKCYAVSQGKKCNLRN